MGNLRSKRTCVKHGIFTIFIPARFVQGEEMKKKKIAIAFVVGEADYREIITRFL